MASERYNKALERARKMKAGSVFGSTGVQSKEEDTQMTTSKRSDRYNRLLERVRTEGVHVGITEKDVNQFYKDVQTYAKDYQTMRNSGSWASIMDDSAATARSSTLEDLNARAKKIKLWADVNKSQLGEQAYNETVKYLDNFSKSQGEMAKDYQSARDYYSRWKSDKEYTDYINSDQYEADQRAAGYYQKYGDMDYMQLRTAADSLPEGEEKDWLSEYMPSTKTTRDLLDEELSVNKQLSTLLMLKDEDDNLKKIVTSAATNSDEYKEAEQRRKEIAVILQREYGSNDLDGLITQKRLDQKTAQYALQSSSIRKNHDFQEKSQYTGGGTTLQEWVNNPNSADGYDTFYHTMRYLDPAVSSRIMDALNYENAHLMKDDERETFNYIYNTQGKEAAEAYMDWLQYTLNERSTQKAMAWISENVGGSPVAVQAVASLLSTPIALLSGEGIIDATRQKIENVLTGEDKPVDYNRDGMLASHASSAIRSSVGQNIQQSAGSGWAKAYQLGIGMQDSAAIAGLSFINPALGKVGTVLLGGSAATQTMLDAAKRGASDEQAIGLGLLSGAFEIFFEKYELESLLGQSDNVIKAMGKQALSESVGEGATEIANIMADCAIMAEKSNWQQSIQAYIDKGMDPREAKKQAFIDAALQVGEAAAGGLISGGIMGGGMAAINGAVGWHHETAALRESAIDAYYADQYRSDIPSLVNTALEQNPDSEIAKAVQQKLDNGQEVTDQEIRQLAEPVVAANMEKTAAGRLQELGETGDVAAISKAAVKSATGQKLTAEEKAALKGSQHSEQVVKELKETHKKEQSAIDAYVKDSVKKARQFDKAVRKAIKNADKPTEDAEDWTDTPLDTVDPTTETPTEGQYEAAADGVTTMKSTGDPVKIKEIASIKNGKMTLRLEDGSEVDASDVQHGTEQEAIIYDAVASLEGFIDGKSATDFADHLLNLAKRGEPISDTFVDGIRQAYMYGYEGHPPASISTEGTLAAELTEKQRNVAYRRGIKYWEETRGTRKGTGTKAAKKTASGSKAPDGKVYGNVQFEGRVKSWGEKQQADVAFLNFVAREFAGGVTVHVYESWQESSGKRYYRDSKGGIHTAPNGKYIKENGDIYIDLNAGDNGEGLVLNTFAHELYHHIEEWSPEKARQLAEFLVKELGLAGVETMVADQIKKAEAAGHGVKYFMMKGMSKTAAENTVRVRAFSDFVADSLETVFTQGNALKILQRLKKKDRSLVKQMKAFVDKWVSKLRQFYKGSKTISQEGDLAAQLKTYEKIQKLFMEALVDAGENYRKGTVDEENSIANEGEILYSSRYSKVFFRENVFPSYKESQSDAHELAERWSRADTTKTGDRKLISYHNRWYLIQAFEDLKYGYQIMEKIAAKDYKREARIYETITGYESLQGSLSEDVTQHYRRSTDGNVGHRFNNDESGRRSENREVYGLDKNEVRWEVSERNSTRDHQGSNSDRRQPDGSAVDEIFSDRNTPYSNRSMLVNALASAVLNEEEAQMLSEYNDKVSQIEDTEMHLAGVREKIYEMTFHPAIRDEAYNAELKELREDAQRTERRLNKLDKELLKIEAMKPVADLLKREKAAAQKTVRAREREKAVQKMADLRERYYQNRQKALADQRAGDSEKRKKTEMRKQIRKDIRDLTKLYRRGKDEQNVKEEMKDLVASTIAQAEALFIDYYTDNDIIRNGVRVDVYAEQSAMLNEARDIIKRLDDPPYDVISGDIEAMALWFPEQQRLENRLNALKHKLKEVFEKERNRMGQATAEELMNGVIKAYEQLAHSDKEYIKGACDYYALQHLKGIKDRFGNVKARDMSLRQLEDLHKAYTMVLHTVRNANKAFTESRSVEELAKQLVSELKARRKIPKKKLMTMARNAADMVGWNYEKLYYALERVGSETMTRLFNNLANSENIVMQDAMDAKAAMLDLVDKYGYNTWGVNKQFDQEFMDNRGKTFRLTLGEMMLMYAYVRRGTVNKQLETGGFVFGKKSLIDELTDTTKANAYKLTRDQCINITNLLTDKQKRFVESMQDYLSDVMGAKGNEVSMRLYGVELFTEKHYMPVHVAGEYHSRADEAQAKAAAGFASMKNAGFTNSKNVEATAPIVLESLMDVWVDHVNEMSRYHGTVPALEDIRRVMNYSVYNDAETDSVSVQAALENSFGKAAVNYFDSLYREANSGAVMDKLQGISKQALSKMRKLGVAYSLSVIIQQPASLVRAYAMIDKKYFGNIRIPGLRGNGTLPIAVVKTALNKWTQTQSKAYAEMLKYAPGVTMAKEIGGFDTASGSSIRTYLMDTGKSVGQKLKTGTGVEKAKAVSDLVDDNPIANIPNLADKMTWIEIWHACKRECAVKYKSLSTEAYMQKVGERFTEVIRATQVYDSIFAKSPMLKSKNLAVQYMVSFMNEPNVVANMAESAIRDLRNGDVKKGAKKMAVLARSVIFTSVLKSLVSAMRDDDENETYIEKYVQALCNNLVGDLTGFNYVPFASDIWSIIQGYDVERPDLAIYKDLVDDIRKYSKIHEKDISDMSPEELEEWEHSCTAAGWSLVGSIAGCLGIPVKNVTREVKAVFNTVKTCNNGLEMTDETIWDAAWQGISDELPWEDGEKDTDKLYQAIIEEDEAYLERLQQRYLDGEGKLKENSYTTAIRKALRENDPRIEDAARSRRSGDTGEYLRIVEEIVAEGHFDEEDVVAAVRSAYNKLKGDDSHNKLYDAMLAGDDAAVEELKGNYINDKGEFSDTSYHSAIQKGLRENDARIKKAAKAKASGDTNTYLEIVEEIVEEGHFKWKDVSAAVKAEAKEQED